MKYVHVQAVPRDGLGFPIGLVVMAASAVAGYVGKKKKEGKQEQLRKIQARSAVQQIYLELLERDPWGKTTYDAGAEGFVTCLENGSCDVDWVRTSVLKSEEWRDRELRRAAQTYGASAPGTPLKAGGGGAALLPGAPGGAPPGGGFPTEIAGIPLVYIIAGVAAVMLLKR